MNESLLQYFETSDNNPSLIKIEEIEINLYPYLELWKQSKQQLFTNYLKIISIHPEEWFEEALPVISKFDYVQLLPNSYLISYSEDDLKMTSFQVSVKTFSTLSEIEKYLLDNRSRFKKTALQSINKIITISDDLKTNQIFWRIKSSEFDFNQQLNRDKRIDQILNI